MHSFSPPPGQVNYYRAGLTDLRARDYQWTCPARVRFDLPRWARYYRPSSYRIDFSLILTYRHPLSEALIPVIFSLAVWDSLSNAPCHLIFIHSILYASKYSFPVGETHERWGFWTKLKIRRYSSFSEMPRCKARVACFFLFFFSKDSEKLEKFKSAKNSLPATWSWRSKFPLYANSLKLAVRSLIELWASKLNDKNSRNLETLPFNPKRSKFNKTTRKGSCCKF